MIERKHQVFVSSTYKDLIEERQQVIHALLELDCIPAGMELFPATDEDAWTLIKEVINDCDYYVLIVAGKYGSTNKEGIGYTELEFDYACSINKPIICFLHENIEALMAGKTEKLEENQKKLLAFSAKAELKHCKYWSTAEDLGGKVSRSMVQLKKRHPSDGWIPGKYAADENLFRTIEDLRSQVEQLTKEKNETFMISEAEISNLAQGGDKYYMDFNLYYEPDKRKDITVGVSWDDIFKYVGSAMISECTNEIFEYKLRLVYWHQLKEKLEKLNDFDYILLRDVAVDDVKVQLQALGLITKGSKKRAVSDHQIYWALTPYGEKYLLKVSAIRKDNATT